MDRYRQIVDLSEDCIKELDLDGVVVAINDNGPVSYTHLTLPTNREV